MSLRASIDLGTNTCLLLIAECTENPVRVAYVIEDHAHVVRLGEGVDTSRVLKREAMDRTLACLTKYSQTILARGIDPAAAVAVATSQARDAQNGADFFAEVKSKTGLSFRILSGQEEARATFLGGLLSDQHPKGHAVIDTGGGSTELMALDKDGELKGMSLDLGCVRFTERYLKTAKDVPVTDAQFWQCQDEIDLMLLEAQEWRQGLDKRTQLVGVAGTATTLAHWFVSRGLAPITQGGSVPEFSAKLIDGVSLSVGDLHYMVEILKLKSPQERLSLPGVASGREDVLLAGAMILWRAMEILNFPTMKVSTRGLRFGVLAL